MHNLGSKTLADVNSMLHLYLESQSNSHLSALYRAVMQVEDDTILRDLDKFRCCRVSLTIQYAKLLSEISATLLSILTKIPLGEKYDEEIDVLGTWKYKYASYDNHYARCLYNYDNREYGGES